MSDIPLDAGFGLSDGPWYSPSLADLTLSHPQVFQSAADTLSAQTDYFDTAGWSDFGTEPDWDITAWDSFAIDEPLTRFFDASSWDASTWDSDEGWADAWSAPMDTYDAYDSVSVTDYF
ncbi:hypothetical protein [Micromonospora sp. LOL_023]|uniref:hypothetical protein n=1 Tax=Micromonospora sp. LOL_023 TaxID=3345418 RepID=UPI003A8C128E